MTDEELKALVASLAISQDRTDAQLKATDAQLARTDAQLKESSHKLDRLSELVGNISNNQGDIAEEFFYTSFVRNPDLGGIHFDSVSRNLNNRIGNLQEEYDIVLINGDTLAVIEVKSKAHVSDMEKLVNRKIPNFQKLFNAYKDYHCYAGIATFVTNLDLIEKAKELGLFLVTQQGDHAEVVQAGRMLR